MTFMEFNLAIMRDPVLGKSLPMQLRRTYPRLSLEGTTLCTSFVGFRIAPRGDGIFAFPPVYYLKITYPDCRLLSYEKIPATSDVDGHTMMPRTQKEIRRLAELCDEVLKLYDEKADNLETALAQYNTLLNTVLEPDQLIILDQFGG